MIRLNMILMLVAAICALGVITSQHKARKLFQDLDAEVDRARQLEVEYGQLQLEMSTWATPPRIEKIARDKLKMRSPDASGKADIPVVAPATIAALRKGPPRRGARP